MRCSLRDQCTDEIGAPDGTHSPVYIDQDLLTPSKRLAAITRGNTRDSTQACALVCSFARAIRDQNIDAGLVTFPPVLVLLHGDAVCVESNTTKRLYENVSILGQFEFHADDGHGLGLKATTAMNWMMRSLRHGPTAVGLSSKFRSSTTIAVSTPNPMGPRASLVRTGDRPSGNPPKPCSALECKEPLMRRSPCLSDRDSASAPTSCRHRASHLSPVIATPRRSQLGSASMRGA